MSDQTPEREQRLIKMIVAALALGGEGRGEIGQLAIHDLAHSHKRLEEVERERDEQKRVNEFDIGEQKDAEYAKGMKELGRLRQAIAAAKERTKDWTADWTTHPPSQGPYGWWRYTSHNHEMEATALIIERNEAREQLEHSQRENVRLREALEDAHKWLKT